MDLTSQPCTWNLSWVLGFIHSPGWRCPINDGDYFTLGHGIYHHHTLNRDLLFSTQHMVSLSPSSRFHCSVHLTFFLPQRFIYQSWYAGVIPATYRVEVREFERWILSFIRHKSCRKLFIYLMICTCQACRYIIHGNELSIDHLRWSKTFCWKGYAPS